MDFAVNSSSAQETRARIATIKTLAAQTVTPSAPPSQKEAEAFFGEIGAVKNTLGEITHFPKATIGKIIRHHGFSIATIICSLPELYRAAPFAFAEKARPVSDKHKTHPNFAGYKNFVNKIRVNGDDYYVRFTVQDLRIKGGKNDAPTGVLHSVFVSEAEKYEPANGELAAGCKNPVKTPSAPVDKRLADFFASVNDS